MSPGIRSSLAVASLMLGSCILPSSTPAQEPAAGASDLPAESQETPLENRVEAGNRIRFFAPPLFPVRTVGVYASLDGHLMYVDSLITGAGSIAIPLGNVSQLEVSTGVKPKTLTGLAVGAAVGVVIGGLIVWAFTSDPDSGNTEFYEVMGATLIIAVPFAGLGAIVGSMIRPEGWEEVPIR